MFKNEWENFKPVVILNLEVSELQDFYTKTGLGSFCKRSISTLINKNKKYIIRENLDREIIIGYGYHIPN